MEHLNKAITSGFSGPTDIPNDVAQHDAWQASNREWWEKNPMRYDFSEKLGSEEFSLQFFNEIDQRFFYGDVRHYMPWKDRPFDPLIDFESLKSKDVLEIGVGNGSHAAHLAVWAKSFTGIDLTEYAVRS